MALGMYPAVAKAVCGSLCCTNEAYGIWTFLWTFRLGTHSQCCCISAAVIVRSRGASVVSFWTRKFWHFGVGINSFCGFRGGSLVFWCFRNFGDGETIVSISAIFSLIGAIFRELWQFLCFWIDGETVVSISAIFSPI